MSKFLLIISFFPLLTLAQNKKQRRAIEAQQKADQEVIQRLKTHVQYLADDKLEGRATGSAGETLAIDYITKEFRQIGILPRGTREYVQTFIIDEGLQIDPSTYLTVNDNKLQLQNDYIPLVCSASKFVSGTPAMALREKGVPWFADVKDWLDANKDNSKFNIYENIQKEAAKVASRGATALFLYNSGSVVDNIRFNGKEKMTVAPIPVIYIEPAGFKKYFRDNSELLDIKLNVAFKEKDLKGNNVVGFIDNAAQTTVVIGAHIDHLGWGETGTALDTGKVIHNGADDNASGIAAMIELARNLKASPLKANNYLFIAFSGEELGLIGSKYWLENPTVITPINYMVNLDMVGRYNAEKKLSIGGYGTSSAWPVVINTLAEKNLQVRFDSSGGGPSDHAAFYRKDIPVLFFFTGTHSDYHKATDDWDKINYEGELQIVKYIQRIIEATDSKGKLAFSKTAEPVMSLVKYSVSLGVIPDYSYANGGGLRIDGISPKKIGERIGLQKGDILTQLGGFKINEINSYMQALSNFKSGDKATLRIKRGKEDKEFAVEF